MSRPLRVATRGSRLALRQVELVAAQLGIDVEPVVISTLGDRATGIPLRAIAGKGAFSCDVRAALAAGDADLAVHSAKDLPAEDDPRFATTYPVRADARDVLVGATLAGIPRHGIVASGAPRRRAQIAGHRPDLGFAELRGNMDTRLARARDFDAVVVAAAALDRLAITLDRPFQVLTVEEMVPQVGQGALAVEARTGDRRALDLLAPLDDLTTRRAVTAERAFLATLGGDCDLPAGAHATVEADGTLELAAILADAWGRLVRHRAVGTDPEGLGSSVARRLRRDLDALQARTVA